MRDSSRGCQSCAGNRIAPAQHQQLGLGTVLARAQARDGVGPAVELSGLQKIVKGEFKEFFPTATQQTENKIKNNKQTK